MNIAIPIKESSTNAEMNPRFGRAEWFCVIDTQTGARKTVGSTANQSNHGAGVQTAQLMIENQVRLVISSKFGPSAENILKAAEVQMLIYPHSTDATIDAVLDWYESQKER
ncbi:MAG: NifB/NifX family molybdenum-iron cluster-binding protein [Anaerolineaceae bacterium]|nr:NifB/NifX family molybdenum-iron cluster-binding protein [Anaerolineaceae bacterium]